MKKIEIIKITIALLSCLSINSVYAQPQPSPQTKSIKLISDHGGNADRSNLSVKQYCEMYENSILSVFNASMNKSHPNYELIRQELALLCSAHKGDIQTYSQYKKPSALFDAPSASQALQEVSDSKMQTPFGLYLQMFELQSLLSSNSRLLPYASMRQTFDSIMQNSLPLRQQEDERVQHILSLSEKVFVSQGTVPVTSLKEEFKGVLQENKNSTIEKFNKRVSLVSFILQTPQNYMNLYSTHNKFFPDLLVPGKNEVFKNSTLSSYECTYLSLATNYDFKNILNIACAN